VLASLTCGPDADEIAQADRAHANNRADLEPSRTPAALVWKASYAAEAAGNLEIALSSLTQLPQPQNGSYLASYRRGWLLYRLGRHAESVAYYNSAIALEPAAIEPRIAKLVPLVALTRWDDLTSAAQEILKRDPENYLAMQRLAYARFNTQHFPDAELMYRHLVQLYPSDIEMRSGLAWALLRMGKRKEAVKLFSDVLEVAPAHASATAGLQEARAPERKNKR
jgi:tetratricopeptide (TPR) repeat protein